MFSFNLNIVFTISTILGMPNTRKYFLLLYYVNIHWFLKVGLVRGRDIDKRQLKRKGKLGPSEAST